MSNKLEETPVGTGGAIELEKVLVALTYCRGDHSTPCQGQLLLFMFARDRFLAVASAAKWASAYSNL